MLRKSLLFGVLALVIWAWTLSPMGNRLLFGRQVPGLMNFSHDGGLAPEFPAGLAWLNSAEPLKLKDLRGKVVLLDFWTFCCINCMHVLPELAKLEEKYKDSLVILGVHSAKFSNEQATAKIRQAVLRYKIRHPVLNDHNLDVWDLYGIEAWPTLVLISPSGRIIGKLPGEGVYDALDRAIGMAVDEAKKKGELKAGAFKARLESSLVKDSPLAFPGKVLADAQGGRLFVSDSNHDRVVVANLRDGKFLSELRGFHNPQGLALSADGATLYVADSGAGTGVGALRSVDLKSGKTESLAEKLNSPWDLCLAQGALYIAMAGSHQIWRYDFKSGKAEPYAGNGKEQLKDGSLKSASFAQPSGLSTDGKRLYSADSESSSIRSLDLDSKGQVSTLVGKGLFEFGIADGDAQAARLQHPLGVNFYEGKLLVADTYNNKIRSVDPVAGGAQSLFGNGLADFVDAKGRKARFNEPGGLWAAEGKLYIADTNNNAVRVADLKSGEVRTFRFRGLK